jgi:hypothetical protein
MIVIIALIVVLVVDNLIIGTAVWSAAIGYLKFRTMKNAMHKAAGVK